MPAAPVDLEPAFDAERPFPARMGHKGGAIRKIVTTTDPKLLGVMYIFTAISFFLLGGLMAPLIRTELARPVCSSCPRAVQPAVHHARHTHAVVLCDPDRVRIRQLHAATADRRRAVNLVTTVVCLRAPGMTMFRMPIFTWNVLVTSILVLLAFPMLTAALMAREVDRHLGFEISDRPTRS